MFTRNYNLLGVSVAALMASAAMSAQTALADNITITYSDWQLTQEGWGKSMRTGHGGFWPTGRLP